MKDENGFDKEKILKILEDEEGSALVKQAWIFRQEIRLLQRKIDHLDAHTRSVEQKIMDKFGLDFINTVILMSFVKEVVKEPCQHLYHNPQLVCLKDKTREITDDCYNKNKCELVDKE